METEEPSRLTRFLTQPVSRDPTAPPVGESYQVDISSTAFDLETVTSNYTGLARIYRLVHIVEHCASLRREALLALLKYTQETHFVPLYKKIVEELKKDNVPLPADFDPAWIEKTQRNFAQKLEKLDTDLKNFRSNSIKDSIRRGHEDLGDHYLDTGDFFNAVRCYVRARDYCVTPRHIISMCLNVIKASFFMSNWSNVLSYVSKAEQAMESLESSSKSTGTSQDAQTKNAMIASDAQLASRLRVYAGIAEMATRRYKIAARHFLGVSFDHCSNDFQDLISPQTLIQYVCLCALATFDRSELHRLVLMSLNVKQYLELEVSVRDILHRFYETSYSSCLALMAQYEPIFALDLFLANHLQILYYEIRHRMIIVYFSPYKNASMITMARQLNTTVEVLEDELVHLIRSGKLQARIDSQKKILYVVDTDQRWTAYQQALAVTRQSENLTRTVLLRSAIVKAELQVKDDSLAAAMRSSTKGFSRPPGFRRQHSNSAVAPVMFDDGHLSDDAPMD